MSQEESTFNDELFSSSDRYGIVLIPKQKKPSGEMLLGITKDGERVYVSRASFDCNWYFGFGYLQTYVKVGGKSPRFEHQSHTHFVGLNEGKNKNIRDAMLEFFAGGSLVLTASESWKFCDYMLSFYTLKNASAFYHNGGSHMTRTSLNDQLVDDDMKRRIDMSTAIVIHAAQDLLLQDKKDNIIKNTPFPSLEWKQGGK